MEPMDSTTRTLSDSKTPAVGSFVPIAPSRGGGGGGSPRARRASVECPGGPRQEEAQRRGFGDSCASEDSDSTARPGDERKKSATTDDSEGAEVNVVVVYGSPTSKAHDRDEWPLVRFAAGSIAHRAAAEVSEFTSTSSRPSIASITETEQPQSPQHDFLDSTQNSGKDTQLEAPEPPIAERDLGWRRQLARIPSQADPTAISLNPSPPLGPSPPRAQSRPEGSLSLVADNPWPQPKPTTSRALNLELVTCSPSPSPARSLMEHRQSSPTELAITQFPSPRAIKEKRTQRKRQQQGAVAQGSSTPSPSSGTNGSSNSTANGAERCGGSAATSEATSRDGDAVEEPVPPNATAQPLVGQSPSTAEAPNPIATAPQTPPPNKERPFTYNELFDYSYFTRMCGHESTLRLPDPPPQAGLVRTDRGAGELKVLRPVLPDDVSEGAPMPPPPRRYKYNELFDYSYFTRVCGYEAPVVEKRAEPTGSAPVCAPPRGGAGLSLPLSPMFLPVEIHESDPQHVVSQGLPSPHRLSSTQLPDELDALLRQVPTLRSGPATPCHPPHATRDNSQPPGGGRSKRSLPLTTELSTYLKSVFRADE